MIGSYRENTLGYDESRCVGCGLCAAVCPHGVFSWAGDRAGLARREACMECGACQRNCPAGAISVDSGVGCATALFYAALTGREASCGPRGEPCCGTTEDAGEQEAAEPCCGGSADTSDRRTEETRCCSDE